MKLIQITTYEQLVEIFAENCRSAGVRERTLACYISKRGETSTGVIHPYDEESDAGFSIDFDVRYVKTKHDQYASLTVDNFHIDDAEQFDYIFNMNDNKLFVAV